MTGERGSGAGPAARSFGRMVRRRRQELGLTLEGLAELVPCSVQHLSEVERGERYASLPLLARVEWALSGTGVRADRVLALVLEQLGLHHPVYATSRGWSPHPATNTSGEELDAAAITARVDDLLAHLRRTARIAVEVRPSVAGRTQTGVCHRAARGCIMARMSLSTSRSWSTSSLAGAAGSTPARRCGCGWRAGGAPSASSSPTWSRAMGLPPG